MKKIVLSTFISFLLTSCAGYETLKTPFTFKGDEKAVEKLGIKDGGKYSDGKGVMSGFEVEVKAPAGTPMETAYSIFNKEAKRLCNGTSYQYEIKSQGNADSMPENLNDTGNQKYPYLTGIVICASQVQKVVGPQSNQKNDNDLNRIGNVVSGTLRGKNYRGSDIRGSSIPGRTINNMTSLGVTTQEINEVLSSQPR